MNNTSTKEAQSIVKIKKTYKTPKLEILGEMVRVTLPGGSGASEGSSGKNHPL